MAEQTKSDLENRSGNLKRDDKRRDSETDNRYGAILLCGGKGTRLRELTRDEIPKSLVLIEGKELIRYSLESMDPKIVKKLVFAVDYKSEQIIDWVNALNLPIKVEFSYQSKPGVLYAVKEAAAHIEGQKLIFCNTDELRINLHLDDAVRYHEASDYAATVVAAYTNALHKHGVLVIDDKNTVLKLRLRDPIYSSKPEEIGLVNTGIIIMNKSAIDYFNPEYDKDWNGITEPLIEASKLRAYIAAEMKFYHGNTLEQVLEANEYIRKLGRNKK